jgi:nucleotide-binding universal stress UspA family protein
MGAVPILPPVSSEKDPSTVQAAERFAQAGLPVERLSVLGDPAGEILDQSTNGGVDLIVMATHGRSGVSRWILGSVAERVLRHAEVPLVLVRVSGDRL